MNSVKVLDYEYLIAALSKTEEDLKEDSVPGSLMKNLTSHDNTLSPRPQPTSSSQAKMDCQVKYLFCYLFFDMIF